MSVTVTSYRLANSAGDAGNYNTFPLHRASSHLQGRLSLVPTSQGRLSLSRSHFTGPSLSRSHFTGPTLRAPLSGILKEGCRKPVLEVCSLSLSLSLRLHLCLFTWSSLSLSLLFGHLSLSLFPTWPSLFPTLYGRLPPSHFTGRSLSFPLHRAISLVPSSHSCSHFTRPPSVPTATRAQS